MFLDKEIFNDIDIDIDEIIGDEIISDSCDVKPYEVFSRCCSHFSSVIVIDLKRDIHIYDESNITSIVEKANKRINYFFDSYHIEHSDMFLISFWTAYKNFEKSVFVDYNTFKLLKDPLQTGNNHNEITHMMFYVNYPEFLPEKSAYTVCMMKRFFDVIWNPVFDGLLLSVELFDRAVYPKNIWTGTEAKRTTIDYSTYVTMNPHKDSFIKHILHYFVFQILNHFFRDVLMDSMPSEIDKVIKSLKSTVS